MKKFKDYLRNFQTGVKLNRAIKINNLFKIASSLNTSFDFDDTIRSSMTGKLNKKIVEEIMSAYANGKVYLVTARPDTTENRNFVLSFLSQSGLLNYFYDFHFTGGLKYSKLLELKIDHHYDDNDLEIKEAEKRKIRCTKVII